MNLILSLSQRVVSAHLRSLLLHQREQTSIQIMISLNQRVQILRELISSTKHFELHSIHSRECRVKQRVNFQVVSLELQLRF